ncbi:hypothetical protein Adt_46081 [Abeliophyllum distichum]|uniref:Uncharacterized protein n=1 Tax=Abeliophyllum distichum TaxID=126358 RepID=A0ABD1P2Q6_9LAMI
MMFLSANSILVLLTVFLVVSSSYKTSPEELRFFNFVFIVTGSRAPRWVVAGEVLEKKKGFVASSESRISAATSPEISRELGKPKHTNLMASPSQELPIVSPAEIQSLVPGLPPKSPLPLPIFPLKEGMMSS